MCSQRSEKGRARSRTVVAVNFPEGVDDVLDSVNSIPGSAQGFQAAIQLLLPTNS